MIYQKTVSIMLCLTLIGGSIPLNAQPIPRKKEVPSYNQTGVYSFGGFNSGFTAPSFGNTGNVLMAPPQKAKSPSPLNFLHPYQGLNYFEAISLYKKLNPNGNISGFHDVYYIKPAWNKYQSAIKDYHNSEFANYTPYQVMNAMSRETKVISELLKKNPRYQKELKKAKVKEYGSACLQGIVLGLLTVAAVYTAGATLGAEGALVATWFGSSAAVTSMTLASASITKGLAAVIMLEMMTFLGSEIVDNLYEDLTQRLVKYNYLTNSQYAQDLTGSAAKASIANENIVELPQPQSCEKPQLPNITRSTRWLDNIAKEESIIRLHGLIVIRTELQYSSDPIKYDMALLDIINLFSDAQQVEFDENVFTRPIIDENGKHYQNNSNIVDVGTGRLIKRTPELLKALKAIQNMDAESGKVRLNHPRSVNGVIWPHK